MIFELEIPDLVDQQRLESCMEERKGLEPAKPARQLVSVDQQARKEEAGRESQSARFVTREAIVETHLKSMTRLPTRFATPAFLITIERSKTTLEAVKLNRTRTRMNRQNETISGTRPTGA